jgi:hypothetical protein
LDAARLVGRIIPDPPIQPLKIKFLYRPMGTIPETTPTGDGTARLRGFARSSTPPRLRHVPVPNGYCTAGKLGLVMDRPSRTTDIERILVFRPMAETECWVSGKI